MVTSVTRRLADFVVQTSYEDLPLSAVTEAKRVILDSIGCALAGMGIQKGKLSVELARRLGGPAQSSIIGVPQKVSPTNAAFANGELISALDYDCVLRPATHVTPFVLPPALALAEGASASGRQLILATVLGHEISSRVASGICHFDGNAESQKTSQPVLARAPIHGYSVNAFGSAAVAGKMLGLDSEKMANCLGIAGYNAPMQASSQRNHSGTDAMIKWASAGWVAQGGATAALLAEAGYTGDTGVLDGSYSFWRFSGSDGWDPEVVVNNLGQDWRITGVKYKRFPCCGVIPLDLFLSIMEENRLAPGEIEDVEVLMDSHAAMPLWRNRQITNEVQAQFSVAYNIAMAALGIPRGIEWQSPASMTSFEVEALVRRIRVGVHPDHAKPASRPAAGSIARIVVSARGKVYAGETAGVSESRRPAFAGEGAKDAFLDDKFRHNAAYTLSTGQIEDALTSIRKLENVSDVAVLMGKLRD